MPQRLIAHNMAFGKRQHEEGNKLTQYGHPAAKEVHGQAQRAFDDAGKAIKRLHSEGAASRDAGMARYGQTFGYGR